MNLNLSLTLEELDALWKVASKKLSKNKKKELWGSIYHKIESSYGFNENFTGSKTECKDEQTPMLYDRGKVYDSIMEIKVNENSSLTTMID
jgi:hypothetical protein